MIKQHWKTLLIGAVSVLLAVAVFISLCGWMRRHPRQSGHDNRPAAVTTVITAGTSATTTTSASTRIPTTATTDSAAPALSTAYTSVQTTVPTETSATAQTTATNPPTATQSTIAATVTSTTSTAKPTFALTAAPISSSSAATQTVITTTTAPPTTTQSAVTYTVTDSQLAQIKTEFLLLVNGERERVGVGILTLNSHLDSCAVIRSNEAQDLWSHTRPDGTLFNTVIDIDRYLYATIGENICMTTHFGGGYYDESYCWTGTPEQIRSAAQWMFKLLKDSPGHYENMVKVKYEDTGIGVTYAWSDTGIPMFYTVQLFGKEVN